MPLLRLRKGVYYYRARLPFDVRKVIGRAELTCSLHTADAGLADVRALEARAMQLRLCRAIRQASKPMTPDQISQLVKRYVDSFHENREADAINYGPLTPAFARERRMWLAEALSEAEGALEHNRLDSTERLALELIEEAGEKADDPDAFRRLCYRLLAARVDVLRDDAKRLPVEPVVAPEGTPAVTAIGPRVSELVGAFLEYRDASDPMKRKTRIEVVAACKAMVDLLGDPVFASVRNKDAQDYGARVSKLPKRWRQMHRGKPATDVLAEYEGKTYPRIEPATLNKEMGLVKAFWSWACTREELPRNAMAAVKPADVGSQKDKRRPFTDEDMLKIAPELVEIRASRPARYWVTTLLAYSGARLEEVAQLRKQDIFKAGDIWCFRISDAAGSVKNAASEREVPIHSAVLARRFLQYVDSHSTDRLFADEEREGDAGQPISKWFGRLLTKLQVPERKKKGMHSFRHTMRDRLLRAGVDPVVRREILGHAHGDVEDQVYGDPIGIRDRSEALEKVRLPI